MWKLYHMNSLTESTIASRSSHHKPLPTPVDNALLKATTNGPFYNDWLNTDEDLKARNLLHCKYPHIYAVFQWLLRSWCSSPKWGRSGPHGDIKQWVGFISLPRAAISDFLNVDMNVKSSQSHSILLVTIKQWNTNSGALKTGNLYHVDLASSEKVENMSASDASGQMLEKAKKINRLLSALGMVINSLTDGKVSHLPSYSILDAYTYSQSMHIHYRDSKLTHIMQSSTSSASPMYSTLQSSWVP